MKHLLVKMASIANELDLMGFEKEAYRITEDMLKIAQAPKDYSARQQRSQLTSDPNKIQQYINKAIAKKQTVNQLYDELTLTSPRLANDMAAYLKAVGITATDKPIPAGTSIFEAARKQNLPLGPNTKIMNPREPYNNPFSTSNSYKDNIFDTSRLNPTLDAAVNEAYSRYKNLKQQNPKRKSLDIINELSKTYYWLKDGNRPEYKRFTAKLMADKGVQKMQDLDIPQGDAGKFKGGGGTYETNTVPSQLKQGPNKNPWEVNPLGNNDIFSPKKRKGLTSYP
jgi:hypothetical protein